MTFDRLLRLPSGFGVGVLQNKSSCSNGELGARVTGVAEDWKFRESHAV